MLKIDEKVRDQIVEFLRQYAMREVEGVVQVLRGLEKVEEIKKEEKKEK